MKKLLVPLLVVVISLTGCFSNLNEQEGGLDSQQAELSSQGTELTQSQQTEKNELENSENTDESDNQEVYEPLSLDMFIEVDDSLKEEDVQALQKIIDKINVLEENNQFDDDRLNQLYGQLDQTFIELGYDLYAEGEDAFYYEPMTLKSFIGFEYDKLTEDQIEQAQKKFDEIFNVEIDEENIEFENDKSDELYDMLKSFGIKVPYRSFKAFLDANDKIFTAEERQVLLQLYSQYDVLYQSEETEENMIALDEIYSKIYDELMDNGFDFDVIQEEINSNSVEYYKFSFANAKLKSMTEESSYSKEDVEKFNLLAKTAIKIIPDDMEKYIKYFVINSDGKDNTLAYVLEEDESLKEWRMTLDINDAFDEEGNYMTEYNETIVHEFGHILTLNNTQMQKETTGTYEIEEGITAEESYLNLFYQTYWKDIADDYETLTSGNEEETSYDFYYKYEDQFVSDYASTNPVEDIAETFRIFVFNEKPEGDAIKDQKVLWMYEFDELVKIREQIRTNLQL